MPEAETEKAPQPSAQDCGQECPGDRRPGHGVDLERLADKVYRLMKADVHLQWARGEHLVRRRER